MRTIHQAFLAGGMAVVLGAGLAGTSIAATETPSTGATAPSATAIADDTRTADLAFSRDEERMARDLYTLFGQTYDAAIFNRIAGSEQQHFDAVGALLTTYAITDPAVGQPAGTYANADLQGILARNSHADAQRVFTQETEALRDHSRSGHDRRSERH